LLKFDAFRELLAPAPAPAPGPAPTPPKAPAPALGPAQLPGPALAPYRDSPTRREAQAPGLYVHSHSIHIFHLGLLFIQPPT
jgi:hypothetical protein